MKKNIAKKIAFAVVGIPAFVTLIGFVVMGLWNWLMPALFGLTHITFWQALGLLVLSKILFGGWKGGGHRDHRSRWKRKFRDRWTNMTEEEREKYRRCWGRPGTQPTEEEVK